MVISNWRKNRAAALGMASLLFALTGCAQKSTSPETMSSATTQTAENVPASAPAVVYDATLPKPVPPRDWIEKVTQERLGDMRLMDRMLDKRAAPPPFERRPLPPLPPDAKIADGLPVLDDTNPFPEAPPLESKEVSIRAGLARSTYRTREPEEVLSAVQPFLDLVQREVNVRSDLDLFDKADPIFFALREGKTQLVISHVFDYLTVRSWFEDVPDNGTVLLGWATPAHPRATDMDRDLPGIPGTSIELIVARDAPYQKFIDLKGKRLAMAANMPHGPGTFLTRLLLDAGHPPGQPFFGGVTLRRYPKDAVIDVIKGRADVACVDQGTMGALARFYGLEARLRTLAVSPRYNVDVLYSSVNNLDAHRTEIELTQRQLNTLQKNAEGQEILFFFDEEGWHNYRDGDIDVPRQAFADYVKFLEETPVDLKILLDPNAPVDRRTYDRLGDE